MSEHTKEPWIVGDGHMGGFDIESEHDSELVAVAQTEHDARRIVACVNACARFSDDELKGADLQADSINAQNEIDALKKQRDELLAALEPFGAIDLVESRLPAEFAMLILRGRAAIAKVKGQP